MKVIATVAPNDFGYEVRIPGIPEFVLQIKDTSNIVEDVKNHSYLYTNEDLEVTSYKFITGHYAQ